MQNQYFYKADYFPWAKELTAHWQIIRAELEAVVKLPTGAHFDQTWLAAHPHYLKGGDANSPNWKTYEFVFFGIQYLDHCEACPQTYALLQSIPELITAQFSLLKANSHIQPHTGYTKMVLRNHLGLIVPEGNQCGLRVGNETRYWQEGAILSFDDSYEHEAWNKSQQQRVVLMIDVAKPAMGYSADEICRWKLAKTEDPFLMSIADHATWLQWYEEGAFPRNRVIHGV